MNPIFQNPPNKSFEITFNYKRSLKTIEKAHADN